MQAQKEQGEQKVDSLEGRDMSSVQSERRALTWMAWLPSLLLKCQAFFGPWKRSVDLDRYRLVVEVAYDLSTMMEIWLVDAELQTKAHIAYWHRLIEAYRGYLLCSDPAGQTFLIDLRTYAYVKGSTAHLLQIDGVDQAKRFVDELCCRLQELEKHRAA